ncbi:PREDICTED: signal transducer and activator of transcription 2 [Crocodylus porosus]|uniref:signal transducer and activator of transcription 2 n=1 Tax=Crocodylus porosus TaxID=8502 RepID=UPI00093F83A2|nr:PREDICTED: signal transducer and activator of transcription 2 [Crocodylus porosus]
MVTTTWVTRGREVKGAKGRRALTWHLGQLSRPPHRESRSPAPLWALPPASCVFLPTALRPYPIQAPPRITSFLGSRLRAWLLLFPPATAPPPTAAPRGRGRLRQPANPRTQELGQRREGCIEQRLNEIQESMQNLERSVRHLEELQDTFDFVYKINQAHKRTNPTDPELPAQTQQLQAMLNSLDQSRKDVLAQMQALLGRGETLRDFVLQELGAWRERQRQACLGAPHDTALDSLEAWCTGVAGALFQLLRVLRTLQELRAKVSYQHDPLETEPGLLERRIREQLASLLRSAFVVEEQPAMPHPSRRQLVLRTNQKFSTCIRLLVKLQDRNQQLVVKMECDKDPPNVKGFRRFNILTSPNKTLMLDERHHKGLFCDFRHVTLKEQKAVGSGKGSKGASEGLLPITEELHLITFTLDYKYQDVELQLQTSTLPVVVISNVCQASAAWASILWFNLLSPDPKDQLFFQTPPPAPWHLLAEALNWQFMAAAGRGLDCNQLHMLAEKLFGADASPMSTLTWIQFSKDSPPGFSFWTWLDGILELIHKHLSLLWKDGLILGFVSKKRERQLLRRRQTGTFLLRFSESCRDGGITFTWVEHGSSDRPEFCSVEPYTKVELESLPLADIIRDYHMLAHENVPENPLKLLYPKWPRDEAFGAYYSNSRKVDLLAQKKYLNRRLIPVSSRQVDDPRSQTEEGVAAAPAPAPAPVVELGPEALELIEGLSLEPGAMEQLEEDLVLDGIVPDVLQLGTDPYMPTPDDGVLLEAGSPESLFAEAGDIPFLQVDPRDFQ